MPGGIPSRSTPSIKDDTVQFVIPFHSSTTWTPDFTGRVRVHVIGAGGSGAAAFRSTSFGAAASGGGAGGHAIKRIRVFKGITYTITVGAGGASVTPSSNQALSGNIGGNSSFVGGGHNIIGNGGPGGSGDVSAVPATAAGVTAGGTATGGDFNYTGGGSGTATTGDTAPTGAATGGGSVGIWSDGYASGDSISTGTTTRAATGGAGVGGKSGSANPSTSNQAQSQGGGTGGPSGDITGSGSGTSGLTIHGRAASGDNVTPPVSVFHVNGGSSNNDCHGGGGNAHLSATSAASRAFGGTGASAHALSSGVTVPQGYLGGGGGACIANSTGSATSGPGSNGGVFVEVLEVLYA